MGRLNSSSATLTIFIFVIAQVMFIPGFSTLTPSPSSSESLDECKRHFSTTCKEEVFDYVRIETPWRVDLWCCFDLIDLGQSCQKALVNEALHKIHAKVSKDYALKLSKEMWDNCVETTDAYLGYH
ncbi:hypothetical protein ACFX2I_042997 [Malus domestica]